MFSLDPASVAMQSSTPVSGLSADSVDTSVRGSLRLSGVASCGPSEAPASVRSDGTGAVDGRSCLVAQSRARPKRLRIDPALLREEAIEAGKAWDVGLSGVPPASNTGGKSFPVQSDQTQYGFIGPRLLSPSRSRLTLDQLFMRRPFLRRVCVCVPEGGGDPVKCEIWRFWAHVQGRYRSLDLALPVHQSGLVDTLTFTFREDLFRSVWTRYAVLVEDDWLDDGQLCQAVGGVLEAQIGLEVAGQVGSRNFYAHARQLIKSSSDPLPAGYVAAGGNRGTVCVHLTGEGCAMLKREHWLALYALLISLEAKITRVDLAHDDFEGSESVDKAVAGYQSGVFNGAGRPPRCKAVGDWFTSGGDPEGRTFYVGSRKSGKLLRVYEKGRQLGDSESPWVRWELELHASGRSIPIDVILDPGRYLAGAYAGTSWISAVQSVIKTLSRSAKIAYASLVKSLARSYGRMLWVMRDVECGADAVLDILTKGVTDVPRRLVMPCGVD